MNIKTDVQRVRWPAVTLTRCTCASRSLVPHGSDYDRPPLIRYRPFSAHQIPTFQQVTTAPHPSVTDRPARIRHRPPIRYRPPQISYRPCGAHQTPAAHQVSTAPEQCVTDRPPRIRHRPSIRYRPSTTHQILDRGAYCSGGRLGDKLCGSLF